MAPTVTETSADRWRIGNSENLRRLRNITADPASFVSDPANLFLRDGATVAVFLP